MRFKEFLFEEDKLEPGYYYADKDTVGLGTYNDERVEIRRGEKVYLVGQYGKKVDFTVGYGDEGRRCYKHVDTFRSDFITKREHDMRFMNDLKEAKKV